MRITRLHIPVEDKDFNIYDNGLDSISMSDLNHVVILAGSNGSGKTRIIDKILQLIEAVIERQRKRQQVDKHLEKDFFEDVFNRLKKIIEFDEDIFVKDLAGMVLKYKPDTTDLENYNRVTIAELENVSKKVYKIGMESLYESTFAHIQVLHNRYISATHPDLGLSISKPDIDAAVQDFNSLNDLIDKILGTKIGTNINNIATLFGLPLSEVHLSEGQAILLQFCVAIHSQNRELSEMILILDEPENHLHPAALIGVINRLKSIVTNGQIWIATHSVPLLAHFPLRDIYFVKNGRIFRTGNGPEQVLQSLLGEEEEVAKLRDFLDLPEFLAMSRFSYECLLPPGVVDETSADFQTSQMRKAIYTLLQQKGRLRMLDYGAGKGRLLDSILEHQRDEVKIDLDRISYVAYDKYQDDKEKCLRVIRRAYQTAYQDHYFNSIHKIHEQHGMQTFDLVVMSNVLHEIEPEEWLALFSYGGTLDSILAENGFLLIVEDCQLPVGEKAHRDGFLVLDTTEFHQLFMIDPAEFHKVVISSGLGDRLKAHLIPKELILRVSPQSKINAIQSLRNKAKESLISLRRSKKSNYKQGRLYAFWSQQYANASIVLGTLTTTEP